MMKPRTVLTLLLITGFVFNGSDGFARKGRVAKPEPTVEAQVEGCKQNPMGMQIITHHALNAAVNPLADRVSSMDWGKFCGCFGPNHFEVSKDFKEDRRNKVSGSHEQYVRQRDAIAVTCAAEGIPTVGAALPRVASHPSGNLALNHSKFEAVTAHCVGSPHGYFTNAKVHLEVQKSPRASKVMGMNPPKYCRCYVTHMRGALGDDMAHQYLTSLHIPSDLDLIAVSQATDGAFEACVAEQIPFK
ncbi:MAG: hypothetical protein Nkreftii_002089 [Candidatus Nitrospira kreftii]|uniref:Uncharacterized protein n=1 Tax=Candidatus Nitrospira kreftii TaxID=2652173 RepID=A0A7S8FEE9_9BACT|nr:MAG: hypothetical protein Nkreftii_002089 [Candidatus Nitrospira kreftii]